MKSVDEAIQMNVIEQYFHVIMFTMLYKSSNPVDETLVRHQAN